MELRNLILAAGDAALEIEKAKAALDEAKSRVESAKATVAEATSAYDQVLVDCEAAGLVRSKVRKAVEELKQAYITAGLLIEAQVSAPASEEADKPRRKRKSKAEEANAEASVQNNETAEAVEEEDPVEASDVNLEAVSEAIVETPVATIAEEPTVVVEADAETPVEVATESSVVEETVNEVLAETVEEVAEVTKPTYLVDNSEMVADIQHIIDESIEKSDAHVVGNAASILTAELKAAADAATSESFEMDLEYFRAHLASRQTVVGEAASAFIAVIGALEAGDSEIRALFPEEEISSDDVIYDDIDDVGYGDVDPGETDAYAEDDRFGEEEPIVEEEAVGVSDDETFPIADHADHEADVSVVENIDSMNFLQEEAPVADAKPAQEDALKTEEKAPENRKPFAAPAFMQNRK